MTEPVSLEEFDKQGVVSTRRIMEDLLAKHKQLMTKPSIWQRVILFCSFPSPTQKTEKA